ncbi:MAG: DNA double-strand break repair nuclease NurA [Acidobacteria bacterium]|nr:DNA double-strand break repair nuclease NurA [Acidobacteriota bacterium]
MIQRDKIVAQLHANRDRFSEFDGSFRDEIRKYREAVDQLSAIPPDELNRRLADEQTPGALPTPELERAPDLCLDFKHRWSNHQEAREWARAVLLNHPTFAIDGSQIKHDPDYSIPIAAVQVAWFENHHTLDGRYTKDVKLDVLAPDDLIVEYDGESFISEQKVSLKRFELEVETMCCLIEKLAKERDPNGPLPLAFFDSSLVISFADRLQGEMKVKHIEAMLRLLRCSKQTGIPIVGYVDMSYARDLTNMLARCFALKESQRVCDANLVDPGLHHWGGRTPVFICARGSADRKQKGVLDSFAEFQRGIGFVYLKTTRDLPPARLEIPLWVYQAGLLDEVIDLVRAEVVVGNGYPYVIQTADAAAVISARDRQAFYEIFQRFASEQGVPLQVSQKATCKHRRR